ncbi:protein E6A [Equid gammaherpesvirus 2]|nr:protein E6A [Equid gammaherpesvirus 2]
MEEKFLQVFLLGLILLVLFQNMQGRMQGPETSQFPSLTADEKQNLTGLTLGKVETHTNLNSYWVNFRQSGNTHQPEQIGCCSFTGANVCQSFRDKF